MPAIRDDIYWIYLMTTRSKNVVIQPMAIDYRLAGYGRKGRYTFNWDSFNHRHLLSNIRKSLDVPNNENKSFEFTYTITEKQLSALLDLAYKKNMPLESLVLEALEKFIENEKQDAANWS